MTAPHQPGSSSSRALLFGALAFAIVFLVIIAGTIGVLVFQHGRSNDAEQSASTSAETTTSPSSPGTTTATATTATPSAEAEYCWSAANVRDSENKNGKIRGGELEFTPPGFFSDRGENAPLAFTTDVASAYGTVEKGWISYAMVGKVHWQDGYDYPGAATAADRMLDCLRSNSGIWSGTSNRQVENRDLQGVTIDGMHGYRASADIMFDSDQLKKTNGSRLVIIVVDTKDGPSVFASEASIGVKAALTAQKEAEESLAVV